VLYGHRAGRPIEYVLPVLGGSLVLLLALDLVLTQRASAASMADKTA